MLVPAMPSLKLSILSGCSRSKSKNSMSCAPMAYVKGAFFGSGGLLKPYLWRNAGYYDIAKLTLSD